MTKVPHRPMAIVQTAVTGSSRPFPDRLPHRRFIRYVDLCRSGFRLPDGAKEKLLLGHHDRFGSGGSPH